MTPLPRPNCNLLFAAFDPSDPPLRDSPSPLCIQAWIENLQRYPGLLPYIIHGILTFGARTGYDGPDQFIISRNLPLSAEDQLLIDAKVSVDEAAGLIERVFPSPPFICSPLGMVPKHDGGRRRIHHLSFPPGLSVNDFIDPSYGAITYASFDAILQSILRAGRGCWIMKRDIRDAFRIVPIAVPHRHLLGFSWRNTFYQECALPFGLRTAPVLFNLFAEALHWILLSRAYPGDLHHYLDDFISIFPEKQRSTEAIRHAAALWVETTNDLGIPRKDSKDELGTTVTVLGLEIDTIASEVRLPHDKVQRLQAAISRLLHSGKASLHDIESLAGLQSFCARAIRLARTFTQSSYNFITFIHRSRRAGPFKLPAILIADLRWWLKLLHDFNGVRLLPAIDRPLAMAFTDACDDGLGGYLILHNTLSPQFAFSIRPNRRVRMQHINAKEAFAVLYLLRRWGRQLHRHRLSIHTDSATVHSAITTGFIRGQAMIPLRELILISARYDIELCCSWIPGSENRLADALSRNDTTWIAANHADFLQALHSTSPQQSSPEKSSPQTPLSPQ
jgi:hypothetical protein